MADLQATQLPACIHPHDAAWVAEILDEFPESWRPRAVERYATAHGNAYEGAVGTELQRAAVARRAANRTLLDIQEAAKAALERRR